VRSLASRVSLTAAVVLAVFIALTALALDRAFRESAEAAVRERLTAQLYLLMADAELDAGGTLSMPADLGDSRLTLPGSGLYAEILDADGRRLWHSPSAVGLALSAPRANGGELFQRVRLDGHDYFVAGLRVRWEVAGGDHPLRFNVFEDLARFNEQLARYRRSLWSWLGAMAALLLVGQALALAWGLRPLRTVARELKAIENGEQARIERPYPRELRRLTRNLNALLDHERAQQKRYKDALGDLAHSLKTPLAVLRGVGCADSGNARTLEEQVTRMDAIVQHQLARAATAGRSALVPPKAVAPVAERLLASLRKVHHKTVAVETAIAPRAAFRGDEGDLMELLGNLLDNAFKWCTTRVRLGAEIEGETLSLTVDDDGPGIPEARRGELLRRGVRLDEATPGHGIGLAMVGEIVAAYGGELRLESSRLGGARFVLRLPGGEAG